MPLWTIGATLPEVVKAAQLEHVADVFELFKRLDDELREQQDAPPRTERELSLRRALEAMDKVVRQRGGWDATRPAVAQALVEAGLPDAAQLAA
mmetsp:Transcript_30142/g.88208  ORF Transcript_30142/g.88208 Transcript_30142/m.88208 type:complete len:94 (-) Transcript_30142:151-432(-)|eukprot:2994299-Prymnesium_polylepis.1